ncbi:MAG TPA: hypothetical protein VHG08_03065 [Longimicrobium sp.]|nr:hypothetical protein [Longimicrobium sp.]
MRTRLAAVLLLAGAMACGGSDEGDDPDFPGVDASGTADTEVFTDSPDTSGVPVAGQSGTAADSVRHGTPGTAAQNESDVGKQP